MTWQGDRQAWWRTRVCAAALPAPILAVVFVVVFVMGGASASAATPGDCQALRKHGHVIMIEFMRSLLERGQNSLKSGIVSGFTFSVPKVSTRTLTGSATPMA